MTDNVDAEIARRAESRRVGGTGQISDPLGNGVTVGWLATAFGLTEETVKRKLRDCPVRQSKRRGDKMVSRFYDLRDAAAYLVTPKITTRDYMRALKRGELPAALQQAAWDALLKRQKWEENAGQLWRTSQVREVLGSTFQTIKFTIQLWVNTLEEQTELTDEQREIVLQLSDGLQQEIYDAMVKQAREGATESQLSELPDYADGETTPISQIIEESDTDDDWEHEIGGLV